MRQVRVAIVVLLVVLMAGTMPMATASNTPDFDVYVPENIVEPGEEATVELEIRNGASVEEDEGDIDEAPTTQARDVTVTLDGEDAPVDVKTGETPLPTMSAQMLVSETFTVAVDEDATAGTYELDVELSYTYTASGGNERTATDTETIEVVVEEEARFDAGDVASDLVVGDHGIVELEMKNVGVENASDAVVSFDSSDPNLESIDPTTTDSELGTVGSEEYVGEWDINETITATAAMELDDDAVARTYPVSAVVQFRDDDGVDRTSREIRVGVEAAHEQRFTLENVSSDLHVGEDGTVTMGIVNEGPHPVTDAVVVVDEVSSTLGEEIGSSSNVYPRETQYAVGDIEPGEAEPVEFYLEVDGEAPPGPRVMEVDVRYRNVHGDIRTTSEPLDADLPVEPRRPRFTVEDAGSDLVVGDRGLVELEMKNTAVENGSSAVVSFDSPDPNLEPIDPTTDDSELGTVGSEEYVGEWEINETITATAAMELDDDAVARTYPITVTVTYEDEESIDRTSQEIRVGVEATHEQTFGLENVSSDLYVGEDGTVSGEVVNDGPHPVDGVVLVVDDDDEIVPTLGDDLGSGSNVYPRETQYAVGTLKPGESEPFEFRLGIGGEAEPGPRVMEADVRYRNLHDDVRRTDDPLDVDLAVAPERDEFALTVDNATVEPGESDALAVDVTNQRDETLTDVEAKAFTNAPLDSPDDEGFVPALEPGETATVTFEIAVDDDASPGTYPLRMDFRYDDERSNSHLSGTYRVPIEVEATEDGLSALAILLALAVLGGAGIAAWRFRDELAVAIEGVSVLEGVTGLSMPDVLERGDDSDDSTETASLDRGSDGRAGTDSSPWPDEPDPADEADEDDRDVLEFEETVEEARREERAESDADR